MGDGHNETAMVHYECHVCSMTATCVMTRATAIAWEDHMHTHETPEEFSRYTWYVIQLPLDI